MLSYGTARSLKDAGYPQPESIAECAHTNLLGPFEGITTDEDLPEADLSYSPTLEELIAGCGERFGHLRRLVEGVYQAVSADNKQAAEAKTPEEAVARLYIALNWKS